MQGLGAGGASKCDSEYDGSGVSCKCDLPVTGLRQQYLLAPKRSYRVPSYALSNQHLSEDALWRSCVMRCACSLPATMSVTGQTAHRRRGAAAWQALAKAHGAS